MSKSGSVVLLASCVALAAITLTGCSAGQLPGEPLVGAESGGAAAGTVASSVPTLVALPASCPSGAVVGGFAGFPLPDATVKHLTNALSCTYIGSSSSDALQIAYHSSVKQTSAAGIKYQMDTSAKTIKGNPVVAALPGYGEAAYTVYAKDAAGILVWNKGVIFSVIDNDKLDSVERVAKGLLGG